MLLACAGSLAALLTIGDCREYLAQYWQQQVVASVAGRREGAATLLGHLRILALLVRVIVVPLGIATMFMLAARWRKTSSAVAPRSTADESFAGPGWFCLLTAIAASLPLMLSPKQAGHYAVPSYPLFALAISIGCLPAVLELSAVWAAAASRRATWCVRRSRPASWRLRR